MNTKAVRAMMTDPSEVPFRCPVTVEEQAIMFSAGPH